MAASHSSWNEILEFTVATIVATFRTNCLFNTGFGTHTSVTSLFDAFLRIHLTTDIDGSI